MASNTKPGLIDGVHLCGGLGKPIGYGYGFGLKCNFKKLLILQQNNVEMFLFTTDTSYVLC